MENMNDETIVDDVRWMGDDVKSEEEHNVDAEKHKDTSELEPVPRPIVTLTEGSEMVPSTADESCVRPKRRKKKEKTFECPTCHKFFLAQSHLRTHVKFHSDERAYRCGVCGKSFTIRSHLSRHEQSHFGGKTYWCDTCGRVYQQRSHLVTHAKSHTEGRTHVCDVCGKAFLQRSTLSRHTKTHTGQRDHKCLHCGKGFIQRWDLLEHIRIHLRDSPLACETILEEG